MRGGKPGYFPTFDNLPHTVRYLDITPPLVPGYFPTFDNLPHTAHPWVRFRVPLLWPAAAPGT